MFDIQNYRKIYPDMLIEAGKFFELKNAPKTQTGIQPRKLHEFLSFYHRNKSTSKDIPQPYVVQTLLRKMCDAGLLTFTGNQLGGDESNSYISVFRTAASERQFNDQELQRTINCLIYGFPCVYDEYKNSVLPLVVLDSRGDQGIGTTFVVSSSVLVTCSHCIEEAKRLSIRDVTKEDLEKSKVFFSKDRGLDLALIVFDRPVFETKPYFMFSDSQILQSVLAMGFPRVPGFVGHLAAEQAKVVAQLHASAGEVVSNPFEIWSKQNLLLISAKIEGGFSGGPVLGENGQCVGVIARSPDLLPDSKADTTGYGTAIPSTIVRKFIDGPRSETSERFEFSNENLVFQNYQS